MQRKLSEYKPSDYLIDTIKLKIEFDDFEAIVTSELNVKKNPEAKEGVNNLVLKGDGLTLKQALLEELPASYSFSEDKNTLTFPNVPESFKLNLVSTCTIYAMPVNLPSKGFYKSGNTLLTECETVGFRELTYAIDEPSVLTKYEVTLVADATKYPQLISNGSLVKTEELEGNKHSVTWVDPIPKPSHLFALVAGNFDVAQDEYQYRSGKKVRLGVYTPNGLKEQAYFALSAAKNIMKWEEEKFGMEYALDCYKMVAVEEFRVSMESTGIHMFPKDQLLVDPDMKNSDLTRVEYALAQSYFHHAVGNAVIIRDWFQTPLKEGLSNFMADLFFEDRYSSAFRLKRAEVIRKNNYYPGLLPARPDSYVNYDNYLQSAHRSIHKKSAEAFRMIYTLDPIKFQVGLKKFIDAFMQKTATLEDFMQTMSDVYQQDLSSFLLWFTQKGTPVLQIVDSYSPEEQTYTLEVKQQNKSVTGEAEPLPMPIKLGLLDEKGGPILLKLKNDTSQPSLEKVLLFDRASAKFVFTEVKSKPTPSLLRGLSAPVPYQYDYTPEGLRLLATRDTDEFNRCLFTEKRIDALSENSSKLLLVQSMFKNNSIVKGAVLGFSVASVGGAILKAMGMGISNRQIARWCFACLLLGAAAGGFESSSKMKNPCTGGSR